MSEKEIGAGILRVRFEGGLKVLFRCFILGRSLGLVHVIFGRQLANTENEKSKRTDTGGRVKRETEGGVV